MQVGGPAGAGCKAEVECAGKGLVDRCVNHLGVGATPGRLHVDLELLMCGVYLLDVDLNVACAINARRIGGAGDPAIGRCGVVGAADADVVGRTAGDAARRLAFVRLGVVTVGVEPDPKEAAGDAAGAARVVVGIAKAATEAARRHAAGARDRVAVQQEEADPVRAATTA